VHREAKTRCGMEVGNDGHAYGTIYRAGGEEMRGWGREYGGGRWWEFKSTVGFKTEVGAAQERNRRGGTSAARWGR
jgi:hypothetical protein